MKNWTLHPDYAAGETGRLFHSLETVFALRGEPVTDGPLGGVSRVSAGGKVFYVKLYRRAGKGFRRWIGRSRLRGERENLEHFAHWGIPCAKVVAVGEEKRGPFFRRGAVITEGLPETDDLLHLARSGDPRLKDRAWVAAASGQLARTARTLHEHRFAHGDFKWRNLLVTRGETPQIYLIDCPAGAFWIPPFLQYRKNKDLACLDKVAKQVLSRTQRLRFYLDYLGVKKLNRRRHRELRHILRFFDGRD